MGFVVIVTENTIAKHHLPDVKENYIYSTFANMAMSHSYSSAFNDIGTH